MSTTSNANKKNLSRHGRIVDVSGAISRHGGLVETLAICRATCAEDSTRLKGGKAGFC
jgi:hypothetical protein